MILFDLLPVETGAGLSVIAFFFVVLAIGIVALMMLRKTIKMAVRMIIVIAVLLIAVVGSVALWVFMKPAPRPIDRVPQRSSSNSTR